MVRLPVQSSEDLSAVPFVTLATSLVMASIVAGLVEEVAFRGYLQRPIEQRHGPVAAILVSGSVGPPALHASRGHPGTDGPLAVAAVYGMLAYLTNSILPSLILHAGGNMFSYLNLLTRGRSEWQASATPAPLIWETGTDAPFWLSCAAFLTVGSAAIWAYRALADVCAVRGAGRIGDRRALNDVTTTPDR